MPLNEKISLFFKMDGKTLSAQGDNGFEYLKENYDTKIAYGNIMTQISNRK